MTRINKLVLNGFKSFAKRTEIDFDAGFNVILGPNGSGKSNILDALTFVLGRISSKSLRTEKLAHLIYNGGKAKKQAAKAEVAIHFDNSKKEFPYDTESVKISRMVKPNGTSVYRINDERKTRTEVLDLMALAKIDPDGHNFILQGDIIKFVEMSAEERRMLIEEISGISIYEDKKKKAINELNKVDEKLKEAEILLSERKTYLKELKKDRDQALKYKDVSDQLKRYKATYLDIRIKGLEKRKKGTLDEMQSLNEQIEKLKSEIAQSKEKVEERKKRISEISQEIETKGEKEQVDLNRDIEKIKIDIASNSNRVGFIETEVKKVTERIEQLKLENKDNFDKIDQAKKRKLELENDKKVRSAELEKVEQEITKIKEKSGADDLSGIEKELEVIEKEEESKQQINQKIVEKKQELVRQKDKIEITIQNIDETISKVSEVQKEHKKEIDNLKLRKEEYKKLLLELNKKLTEDTNNSAKLGEARKKLANLTDDLAVLRNKMLDIREQTAGGQAVKAILSESSLKGVFGTVGQLGSVKPKYTTAMEVCAGPRLNSVVVDSDSTAAKSIKHLRARKLGTASFLPLNKVKGSTNENTAKLLKQPGVLGLALDFVKFESKYKAAFSYVFGNTIVVENIETARKIGIGEARMVTLDGDLAEGSGVMVGGYRQKKVGSFKDEETNSKLEDKENEVHEANTLIDVLTKNKATFEEEITLMKNRKAELEGEIIKVEKSLHLDSSDLDNSMKKKDDLEKELKDADKQLVEINGQILENNKEIAQIKSKKQILRDKISQLSNPAVIAELNTFSQKRQDIRDELSKINGEISTIDMQLKDIFGAENEKAEKIVKQIQKEKEDFSNEKTQLTKKNVDLRKELKDKELAAQKFQKQFRALFAERQKLQEEIQKEDEKIIRKEEQINTVEVKINNITLKNAEVASELSGLAEEFKEFQDVKLLTSVPEEQLKTNITSFERSLAGMGNVNMKALEIYEDVEQQYASLIEKKDVLLKEKETVENLMNEIEEKKKDLFMNTFNTINELFKKVFLELTTKGGDAYMIIENEKDPFEGGVRVRVRISGNKFLDIRSLSGGEKTMTALAFIFAIQEMEPASFYIMDEVDAALDKRNSAKLSELIKQYSDGAQYIVISHNDTVLSEANTLYGISMDEHGISNVVSLKV